MTPILIVDDDAELRRALALLLGHLGPLAEAADGADGLSKFSMERPRLVLLDVTMPGMGGLEALKAMLLLDPAVVVWMLTAESEIGVAKQALDLGARAYITKPFDGDSLRSQTERFLASAAGPAKPDRPWHVGP